MLREDYVSFEQAKKLKELGFPQDCTQVDINTYFDAKGNVQVPANISTLEYYARPTLSLVQKWLWEEKRYAVFVKPMLDRMWDYTYEVYYDDFRNEAIISKPYLPSYTGALFWAINDLLNMSDNENKINKK